MPCVKLGSLLGVLVSMVVNFGILPEDIDVVDLCGYFMFAHSTFNVNFIVKLPGYTEVLPGWRDNATIVNMVKRVCKALNEAASTKELDVKLFLLRRSRPLYARAPRDPLKVFEEVSTILSLEIAARLFTFLTHTSAKDFFRGYCAKILHTKTVDRKRRLNEWLRSNTRERLKAKEVNLLGKIGKMLSEFQEMHCQASQEARRTYTRAHLRDIKAEKKAFPQRLAFMQRSLAHVRKLVSTNTADRKRVMREVRELSHKERALKKEKRLLKTCVDV
jgi:hypothetical protein